MKKLTLGQKITLHSEYMGESHFPECHVIRLRLTPEMPENKKQLFLVHSSTIKELSDGNNDLARKEKFYPVEGNPSRFTNREIEFAKLTVSGYSSDAIAEKMVISKRMTYDYLHNLKIKVGARNKSHFIQILKEVDFLNRIESL